jgi:hypothetical protein
MFDIQAGETEIAFRGGVLLAARRSEAVAMSEFRRPPIPLANRVLTVKRLCRAIAAAQP